MTNVSQIESLESMEGSECLHDLVDLLPMGLGLLHSAQYALRSPCEFQESRYPARMSRGQVSRT